MCIEDHFSCGPHSEQEEEEENMFQKTPGDHPVEKVVTQEVRRGVLLSAQECPVGRVGRLEGVHM